MVRAIKSILILAVMLGLSASARPAAADIESTVADLLKELPAADINAGQAFAAELAALGPEGVGAVCQRLLPPGAGDDSKERFALHGLALHASRPGARSQRKMVAQAYLRALDAASDAEVKAFLIRQIQLVGKREAVAPLSLYLTDARLCEPAAQALLGTGERGVSKVFRDALSQTSGANRVTLIVALGRLQDRRAAKVLRSYAAGEDEEVRQAALFALANMGDEAFPYLLAASIRDASPVVRERAMSLCLLNAQRLAETGRKRQSATFCREALHSKVALENEQLRCRALSTLVAAAGRRALPDLLAAMDEPGKTYRLAALHLAPAIPGRRATRAWVEKLNLVSNPQARAEIVAMLGRRGDPTALPALQDALKDAEKVVRLSAVSALALLAGSEAVPALLGVLQSDDAEEILAVKEALLRLPGDAMLAKLAEVLPRVPFAARVALLEVLGARRARAQVEAVFAQAEVDDAAVRLAALKALAELANERDLDRLAERLLEASSPAEQSAAGSAIAAVCRRLADPDPATQSLLAVLADAPADRSAALLETLAGIGGKRAFEAVLRATQSGDETVQDAAIRALAEWPDPVAADALLDLACRSEKTTHQVLAWRGYIRLAGLVPGSSRNERFQMYKTALQRAQRPEEKRLALAGLAGVRTLEALQLVGPCLEDENLSSEAAAAAVQIACSRSRSRAGILDPAAAKVLRQAEGLLTDERQKERVARQLSRIAMRSGEGSDPTWEQAEGFSPLFNGLNLTGWTGALESYKVEEGKIVCLEGQGGNLFTEREFGDFILRFEFKLTPGANNGLGIRAPLEGNAAYDGMEIQILDDTADKYKDLKPYQFHGSIYGVAPARRGYLNPVGEWNSEEVIAQGRRITVRLNGTTIVDADIAEAGASGTIDGQNHPGLQRDKGHIGFLGHGSRVEFRNLRVKELPSDDSGALVNQLGEEEQQAGFDLLFDGESLAGWQRHEGLPGEIGGKWTVEDGAIVGRQDPPGQGGFLTTLESYRDFDLRLETWVDWPFDSGVFLRVGPDGKSHQVTLDYRPGGEVGGIYCSWTQGFVQHCTGGVNLFKRDAWNSLRVVCQGEPARIQVWLNGVLITDFQHTAETTQGVPEEGTLCLQVHPGGQGFEKSRALFRTIRVREMARSKD